MLVYMAVAFIIAVLSGLGVGGGGLFTVYLSVFTDTPQLTAQGLNLLFFLFSSGASVTVGLFKRRVALAAVGVMVVSGIVGVLLGALAANFLPEALLRKIFGVMLVAGGIMSFRGGIYSHNLPTNADTHKQKTVKNDSEDA